MFSMIVYFNPRNNIYESALNEGTLTLVDSNRIIHHLSLSYTMSENRQAQHVKAEAAMNTKIQEYISANYQNLFASAQLTNVQGAWDRKTTFEFLRNIHKDGQLKYLISAKLQILQFKYGTLRFRVYPVLERTIEYFERRQK